MKNARRKATDAAVVELSDLVVEEPETFLRRCRPVLAKALTEAGNISFVQRRYARGQREYVLVSALQSRALAREYYPVVPLANTLQFSFWIAVAFRFSPYLGRHRLIHASLILFEGLAADSSKRPLVRAEWDESGNNDSHAQPHWHVYPIAAENETLPQENPAVEEMGYFGQEEGSSLKFVRRWEGAGFHYAMAAQWHLANGSHRSLLTEDGLLRWLPGCISYTKSQLFYLDPTKT